MEVVARPARLVPFVLALLLAPGWSRAEGDHPAPTDAGGQQVQFSRLEVSNRLLEEEAVRLETGEGDLKAAAMLLQGFAIAPPAMRVAAIEALIEASQPLLGQLQETAARLRQRNEELAISCVTLREELTRRQRELLEVQSGRRIAATLASLLSVDKRWFWLFGVLAVGALLSVVLHDRRHELRRFFNGGRARAMGLSKFLTVALVVLLALAVTTFIMGDRIYDALLAAAAPTPGQSDASAEEPDLTSRIAQLQQFCERLKERCRGGRARWQEPLTAGDAASARLVARWWQLRDSVQEGLLELGLSRALTARVKDDIQRLDRLQGQLAADSEARTHYLRLKELIRGGVGLALLVFTLSGTWLFYRGRRQRRQRIAQTCPLCLGRGHLVPVSSPTEEPVAGRGSAQGRARARTADDEDVTAGDGRSPNGPAMVRCRNVISRQPYEECEYRFARAYRALRKLCFPTLGVPQAGKTHWLAMIYWQLNQGNYPGSVTFEKLRSQSAQDFDLIVEEILTSRIGTAATQRERIPHPLVFNFRDHDRWGQSNLLVNIFDYSGEVTADMGVEDFRRRRALEADGYLFFLDPTYPSQPQSKALAEFREDLRLVKGVRRRGQIRTPVALCVSKIDLLARQSFALPDGSDVVQHFYEELRRIDPTGESMSLEVMQARSRLVGRLRETIWPGWQIERQVHDLFGGRYLFFPLTPVGLDGRGETDLSLRTISPFGLLEPLIWLLQMNGYRIV